MLPPFFLPLLPPPSPAAAAINPSWQFPPGPPQSPPRPPVPVHLRPIFPPQPVPDLPSSARRISSLPGSPQRAQGTAQGTQRPEHVLFPWSPPFVLFPLATGLPASPQNGGQARADRAGGRMPCALCPFLLQASRLPRACRPGGRASMPTWAPGAQCTGRWRSGAASAVMA